METMCGGENLICQDYLRIQEDNNTSIPLIAIQVHYLGAVYSNLDKDTILLAIELLTTITECCLGNLNNQMVLFDEKILDPINAVIRQSEFKDCSPKSVAKLKREAAVLILSLIESGDE